jgi:nucleotide-binding universal stress UspA family protein
MPSKILIATDGSEHAGKAVAFGADLAEKYGAEVVLVHVLLRDALSENLRHMAEVEHLKAEGGRPLREAIGRIPDARFPIANLKPETPDDTDSVLRAVGEAVLDRAESTCRDHGVREVTKELADGDAAKRILEIAEEAGADMIVTGARGLSDWKAMLLGSVSHKLSHLAPVTVVSVR